MKRIQILFTLALVMTSVFAVAQSDYLHRVVIVNEGPFGGPVTIGAYNPAMGDYNNFDTIAEARFASDVLIDGNEIYLAADTLVIVYDKDSYQRLRQMVVKGVRKLAVWNNQLLLTRGEVGGLPSYFQVYDKDAFTLEYELSTSNGPAFSAEGVVIHNDSAYLAINNAYDPDFSKWVGKIGIVDLNAQGYAGEVDLGADGVNPDNLMIDNGEIYTLNNKDWTGSSISFFDPSNRTSITSNLPIATGCGSSVHAVGYVYYQEAFTTRISRWSTTSKVTEDTLPMPVSAYGMVHSEVNDKIYIGSTDFTSYGRVYVMRESGILESNFNTGISPGNLALDIRKTSGISGTPALKLDLFPNPATDHIDLMGIAGMIEVVDMLGATVLIAESNGSKLQVSDLTPGVYILRTEKGTARFVKQ
jgi:hypothetical protein